MFDFFRKYSLPIIVFVGLLVALITYSLNLSRSYQANMLERGVNGALAPMQQQATRSGGFFGQIWHDYIALVNLKQENSRLTGEIKQLNSALAAAGEALRENERLARLLDLRKTIKEPTVAAMVIGEDVTPWFRSLTLDRGSESGIREGMPVLAADGVVGQTVKVTANSSRVLLLTDHASGIAAMIHRSRARGVVKGRGDNLCSLEFAMRGEDVQVGDQVVSSGIGGIFAKGLPIGEVTMVKKGEYGIFQTVSIRPTVSTAHLEEVLVVLRAPRD
ncbi:MAG: rod shape-determining protein MreC [Trichlorobacter sp.]|uniref:rod shape-determining protein MreC n=1 Tax=Trichlorobacter sp. TaxID=2911007 RepID=UPI00256DDB64|nr:rod shape-determining protein MreC [Trichlorobacter sp.]MDK9717264.1 rod shape-determining protein MreC [Trichlorobacter sp.]